MRPERWRNASLPCGPFRSDYLNFFPLQRALDRKNLPVHRKRLAGVCLAVLSFRMRQNPMVAIQRLLRTISKTLLLLVCIVTAPCGATTQIWTVLAVDPRGDGQDPSLADAAQLSYRYDKQQDMLWFRVSLYGKPNEEAFGVNIVVDTGANDADKMNW